MLTAFVAVVLSAPPPSLLQITEPVIDVGEARAGPTLVRRFAFVNAGTEPLTITDLKASCGCVTPALPQRTYRPGERGELALEVNTLSQPAGPNRWTLRVGYRCGDRADETTLELTARLKQEITVTPAALVFQGDGEMVSRVYICDLRGRRFAVRSLSTSSPHLRASDGCGFTYPHTYNLEVRVNRDCPEGRHAETVTITTDDPDYPEIKLPVTILRQPRGRVTASPARATLVAGGSALVQLRDADGQPVQVEAIEAGAPALTTRWAAGPGNVTTVRVGLDRSKWRGEKLTGEVRVRLREPAGEVVVIPVAVRPDD
jgi:hypothetical protein